MKFTEAEATWLRAALDGKTVQWRNKATGPNGDWRDAKNFRNDVVILSQPEMFEVRIKPDVIVVNGIEVPAPEKEAPAYGSEYYVPNCSHEECYYTTTWFGSELDKRRLERGVVHLVPQNASVHGKAQLAHKPG